MEPALPHPERPLEALAQRLWPVAEIETVPLAAAAGRVLAQPLVADRDNPPSDVSAMDGYAVRRADLFRQRLPVSAEAAIGAPAPPLVSGQAVRVVTGACVPAQADAVVMREDVQEAADSIQLKVSAEQIRLGQHIRRRAENLAAAATVLQAGAVVEGAVAGALATFGAARVAVRRRVRVRILVTGDEVLGADAEAEPWQVRDANGPVLSALLGSLPFVVVERCERVPDQLEELTERLRLALSESDAVVLSGGVSVGVHDYVPSAVEGAGGEVVFHRLPIRPGKPILGGVGPAGQLVLGLPGNPVSVLITARWFGHSLLGRLAGAAGTPRRAPVVRLTNPDTATLQLWWFRLVRLVGVGGAELLRSQGSGDLVSAARSDGFVLVPPGAAGAGPWPYYPFRA